MQVRAAHLFIGVLAHNDGLFGDDPFVRTEDLPSDRGLGRSHQIGMRPVGVSARQLNHLGAQRRQ